jgi:histidine ammonia-lyase
MATAPIVTLDGESLTIEKLVRVARDPNVKIVCDAAAKQRVASAAQHIRSIVDKYTQAVNSGEKYRESSMDYGVTTGFGEFKRIPIQPGNLRKLQNNIILSHAAGVGETLDENDLSNYYPAEVIRAVLVLRINTFLKGHSGIRQEIVDVLESMVNERIIPLVPLRGSVGSSGDLAPLAHLFLVLCKAGRESTRFYQIDLNDRAVVLQSGTALLPLLESKKTKFPDPEFEPKEGLALTNGATFSAAMLALAVHDAISLADCADIAAAMSAEALLGCARAFDEEVHKARNQEGQKISAANVRRLLKNSKLLEVASEVQDPYSIRCAPAVHGASRDALEFARTIVSNEINAATDNPLFFGTGTSSSSESWDLKFKENWPRRRKDRRQRVKTYTTEKEKKEEQYDGTERYSYSAGNFHGQPIALAADFLAIALAEFADISERRTQLLMDSNHNRGLPANLIPEAGVNSGFMIAQYCAASLVSENKVLTHPASVDSIPTSANSEDHNSMATIAARKLRTVLANTRHALAIELMVAAQALEWATLFEEYTDKPMDQTKPHAALFKDDKAPDPTPQELWERGKKEKECFKEWTAAGNRETIQKLLGQGTGLAYKFIRDASDSSQAPKSMIEDKVLGEDIRRLARLLDPGPDNVAALVAAAGLPHG